MLPRWLRSRSGNAFASVWQRNSLFVAGTPRTFGETLAVLRRTLQTASGRARATVLAASVIEAILLWSLQQRPAAEVANATVTITIRCESPQKNGPPKTLGFHENPSPGLESTNLRIARRQGGCVWWDAFAIPRPRASRDLLPGRQEVLIRSSSDSLKVTIRTTASPNAVPRENIYLPGDFYETPRGFPVSLPNIALSRFAPTRPALPRVNLQLKPRGTS